MWVMMSVTAKRSKGKKSFAKNFSAWAYSEYWEPYLTEDL